MLSFDCVKSDPVVFQTMTSLTLEEFGQLCVTFDDAWEEVFGVKKESEPSGRGRRPTLKTLEDNLFFILFYLKCYPLQTVIGFLFGMKQSTANDWIHELTAVLSIALEKLDVRPERDPSSFPEHIEGEEQGLIIDGTERRIERPLDNEVQKDCFSGKKKCHARKNNLIVGEDDRQVKYLGGTHEGKKHDKRIADEENVQFPKGADLQKDMGFQGYNPEGVITHQPKKKPRGGELTKKEKEENRLLSHFRVVVEQVIGGVKRLHIVKDVFRNKKEDFDDLVMEIACGLHNFRTSCRMSPIDDC